MKYQRINGIHDDAIDRMPEYKMIFPETAKGLSILDLGCYMGFYLLEAKKEGAGRCVGIEKDAGLYKEAVRLNKHFKHDIKYQNSDVKNLKTNKEYDVILCLSLLHHLKISDINNLLEKIIVCARKRAAFIIIPPSSDVLWSIEDSSRDGTPKTRLTPAYLHSRIPWTFTTKQCVTMPERILVEMYNGD